MNIAYGRLWWVIVGAFFASALPAFNAAWDGMSAFIESLMAYIVLGERFSDPNQYIGIALIGVGLFFLKIPMN